MNRWLGLAGLGFAALLVACGSSSAGPAPTPTPLVGFACTDTSGGSAQAQSRVVTVRVEHQQGFDRMTIQFDGGVPAYTIRRQSTTSFTESPRGTTVTLEGSSGVLVTIQPIADWTSYSAPTAFKPAFHVLREARLIQNFEAVQQWGLGVLGSPCLRVSTPASPSSLVVDIASP